jgi:hypothetical protein
LPPCNPGSRLNETALDFASLIPPYRLPAIAGMFSDVFVI